MFENPTQDFWVEFYLIYGLFFFILFLDLQQYFKRIRYKLTCTYTGGVVSTNKIRLVSLPSQCGATAERRTWDREVPGSKLACAIWFFP